MKEEIAHRIREMFPNETRLEKASVPEFSFKPDFMLNFENLLTFIEIVSLKGKRENADWKTLQLIEYIFEAKLFFGNDSVFLLIILDRDMWKPYCLELLEEFFDKVLYGFDYENERNLYTRPKEFNYRLWDLEREFTKSRYKQLKKVDLGQFVFRSISGIDLEQMVYNNLLRLNLEPIKRYGVRNLKNYYLTRDMNLKFYFDFFVNNKIVEVKSFRKMNTTSLQGLLIKSRLIRYQKINNVIRQLPASEMILIINGDVSGPKYDKMRYLRMLTTAGWDVYSTEILANQRKMREVFSFAS